MPHMGEAQREKNYMNKMGQRFPQEGNRTCACVQFTGRKNAKLLYEIRARTQWCAQQFNSSLISGGREQYWLHDAGGRDSAGVLKKRTVIFKQRKTLQAHREQSDVSRYSSTPPPPTSTLLHTAGPSPPRPTSSEHCLTLPLTNPSWSVDTGNQSDIKCTCVGKPQSCVMEDTTFLALYRKCNPTPAGASAQHPLWCATGTGRRLLADEQIL